MARVNDHYLALKSSYLFSEIAGRIRAFQAAHPEAKLIRLGIGDVTRPLPPSVVEAMHAAVDEMARVETFRGYPPETGWDFLLEAIARHDFGERGVKIATDEIVVSDGSKTDVANIQEIFSPDCVVALTDPVYPVYLDSNVMAGRAGAADAAGRFDRVVYLPCTADNGFLPRLPDRPVDLIYLCYPNNPTGAVMTRAALKQWVDYARERGAVILYDAAYEAYIRNPAIPHSIYEIEGAREAAIEFRSFSKSAGFTGTRCAYTVVPKELQGRSAAGAPVSLQALWVRRQSTKFNGVAYVIQRGARPLTRPRAGARSRRWWTTTWRTPGSSGRVSRAAGLTVYGAENAPYIWVKTPGRLSSWEFFDKLVNEAHVVGTPGAGFGPSGEGYFRLTAFGGREATQEAVERIKTRLVL
jgi:LL-diaminopimelate aminotransferase